MSVQVEDYRESTDDADTINAALRDIETFTRKGAVLEFDSNRLYVISSNVRLNALANVDLQFNNCTVQRTPEADIKTTLNGPIGTGQAYVTMASIPPTWRVGDVLFAYTANDDNHTSRIQTTILNINQSTKKVTLSSGFGDTLIPQPGGLYPSGTTVCKNVALFAGISSTGNPSGISEGIRFFNGIFDGQRSTYNARSWVWNAMIYLAGRNNHIQFCEFRDTPAECIVGHGVNISKCFFHDLNGSAFHTSIHDNQVANLSHAVFTENIVHRSNEAATATGHSEGAITFSWNGGYLRVTNNEFKTGGTALMGNVNAPNIPNGSRHIMFAHNQCMGFGRVFNAFQNTTDVLHINVSDNQLIDCGDNTALFAPFFNDPHMILTDNTCSGNTVMPDNRT